MNVPNNSIPRQPLTIESTRKLRETLAIALNEMLVHRCPCHYPRFRYLTAFQHCNYNAGPVFCADTNYLISVSRSGELGFLEQTGRVTENPIGDYSADIIYTCCICSTVYKCVGKQYSINFEFEYLMIVEKKYGADIGAEVSLPIPLLQGLYGFDDHDILICAKEFKLGTADEVFKYLTKRK